MSDQLVGTQLALELGFESQSHSPTPKGVVGLGTHVDGPNGTDRDRPGLGTLEGWIAEARDQREQRYGQHRLLVGEALREELRRVRAIGKARRHEDRLRRAAQRTEES